MVKCGRVSLQEMKRGCVLRRILLFLVLATAVIGCSKAAPDRETSIPDHPKRIVSLDYCADQFVLKFANNSQIAAVSPDAEEPFSYMRAAAEGVPVVRPIAEDVLALNPDLIVRSYGGGPKAGHFFSRAGVPVLQVGYAADLNGVRRVTLDMAQGLGAPEKGRTVVAELDAKLLQIKQAVSDQNNTALYMTTFGVTTGPGSLVHELMAAAGLENFEAEPGWRPIPLERLVTDNPDTIAAAFFDDPKSLKDRWSAMRHPISVRQLANRPSVHVDGAWTSCGGWFVADAVKALANGSAK